MKKIFWVLCLSLYPAIAAATNFDVCVNEAKANNNNTTVDNYTSYKCVGATAEKLMARPDECAGGQKPSDRSLILKTRRLADGLFSSLTWKSGKCSGLCETQSSDSKDTTYTCTLRIYNDGGGTAENPPPDNSREQPPPAAGPGPAPRQAANEGGRRRRTLVVRSSAWSPRLHRYGGGGYNSGGYEGDRYGGRYRFGGGYRSSFNGGYSSGGYGPPPRPSSWVPEPPGGWGPSPSNCDCY